MTDDNLLARFGLFSAKVPRYTSYPPANRFLPGEGARHQENWLASIHPSEVVSLYIHIPFCRRLCWFCACRTQGTRTLRPVEAYVESLVNEIVTLKTRLPEGVSIARLHLGGGTPTLLSVAAMDRLLDAVFTVFPTAPEFEFSVEIDPTEAAEDLLHCLAGWGMNRASIGVQDFAPVVQAAIGRAQSFEQTRDILDILRAQGVGSVNLDLLYGLPLQTEKSLARTLTQVLNLAPDRLALYGYAHVPQMSKRQVMIDEKALPSTKLRFDLTRMASQRLQAQGYVPVGIDHFARPGDGLSRAAATGGLRRNFQGYTDDPCDTLIGLGASAISRFREGYSQNAVATAAYTQRVKRPGLAADRGFAISDADALVGQMIEAMMCYHRIELDQLTLSTPAQASAARQILDHLFRRFPGAVEGDDDGLSIAPDAIPLTRIIAAALENYTAEEARGSLAI